MWLLLASIKPITNTVLGHGKNKSLILLLNGTISQALTLPITHKQTRLELDYIASAPTQPQQSIARKEVSWIEPGPTHLCYETETSLQSENHSSNPTEKTLGPS